MYWKCKTCRGRGLIGWLWWGRHCPDCAGDGILRPPPEYTGQTSSAPAPPPKIGGVNQKPRGERPIPSRNPPRSWAEAHLGVGGAHMPTWTETRTIPSRPPLDRKAIRERCGAILENLAVCENAGWNAGVDLADLICDLIEQREADPRPRVIT